jgi:hypothetical protein
MRLPEWLKMHDLNDLKARVISMIILVAAVSFVDAVVEAKGALSTLYLGAAVAVVIAALTVSCASAGGSDVHAAGRSGACGLACCPGAPSQRSSQLNCSASTCRTDSLAR